MTETIDAASRPQSATNGIPEREPVGWTRAFRLIDQVVPPLPTYWPCWYASTKARIRLLDALNLVVEVRRPKGAWELVAYGRSFDDAVASARRRGLVPDGVEVPSDARRWPYGEAPGAIGG